MLRKISFSLMFFVLLLLPEIIFAKTSVQELRSMKFGPKEAPAIIQNIIENRKESVPELINLLKSTDKSRTRSEIRKEKYAKITAINLLGEMEEKEGLDTLKKILLTSVNPSYIFNSARAIGKIGGEDALKILLNALKLANSKATKSGFYLKRASIIALGLGGDRKAVPPLENVLEDYNNDELTRIYAAGSLGLLGSEKGLETANMGLESTDPQIRMRSIQALGLIGSKSSQKSLEILKREEKHIYKKAATLSLSQIKYRSTSQKDKVKFLKELLIKHPKRAASINWGLGRLSKINTDESLNAMKDLRSKEESKFRFLKQAATFKLRLRK